MTTITESIQLTVMSCCECGGSYALNERYRKQRQDKGGVWHCPYCNSELAYTKSEVQRLREELANKEAALVRANSFIDIERQKAAKAERKLKRVEKGVCSCCNRSFTNLRRHMSTVHGIQNGEPAMPKKP